MIRVLFVIMPLLTAPVLLGQVEPPAAPKNPLRGPFGDKYRGGSYSGSVTEITRTTVSI